MPDVSGLEIVHCPADFIACLFDLGEPEMKDAYFWGVLAFLFVCMAIFAGLSCIVYMLLS